MGLRGAALLLALCAGSRVARAEATSPPRVEVSGAGTAAAESGTLVGEGDAASDVVEASIAAQDAERGPGTLAEVTERQYFAHPYGLVEFGLGIMALPYAKLCGGVGVGCDEGDLSVEVEAWPLFRASPSFAVGAGLTLALIPMQDVPERNTTFPREHARNYFTAEGIGRYYFVHGPGLEMWSGISAGLVVVSDNFRTRSANDNVVLIGSDSANIATEGLSLGIGTGVTLGVNRNLQVGATLRLASWFLPSEPEQLAFGDIASLAGQVTMLNLAFTVAYHGH